MGKSSKDKRDSYYRLAKEQGYRARSAFKLLQLNEQFNLFPTIDTADSSIPNPSTTPQVRRVVDLCAAPGSWSQVLSRYLSPLSTPDQPIIIVALDLQPMAPLPGVVTLQADITHPSTLSLLHSHLRGGSQLKSSSNEGGDDASALADLVLSDGAPDVTGLHDLDEYIQSQLLLSALTLAACVLRPGGTFVAKIFRGRDVGVLFIKLRCVFDRVSVAKPRSSRGSSVEAFVVCEGFRGGILGGDRSMAVWREKLEAPWEERGSGVDLSGLDLKGEKVVVDIGKEYIAPFIACGDLSAWDSDATYQLEGERVTLEPVQKPTAPPYKTALEMRRMLAGEGKKKEKKEKEKKKDNVEVGAEL